MLNRVKKLFREYMIPNSKLIIFNYHQLGVEFNSKIHNKHIWNSVSFFEEQMTFLKDNYNIVALKDGVESLRKNKLKETQICITFDDGDASIVTLVMPILRRLKIPATFFINTAYGVEKAGYWYNLGPYFKDEQLTAASSIIRNTSDSKQYNELLKLEDNRNNQTSDIKSPFYADYEKLKKCNEPLFHFGLHGHEHYRFSMLTYTKQKENLQRNITVMQSWQNYVPLFAVPFGQPKDWNHDTLKVSKELNVIPLLANKGYNSTYHLPLLRFSVDGIDVRHVLKNLSPFQKTYNRLNNL